MVKTVNKRKHTEEEECRKRKMRKAGRNKEGKECRKRKMRKVGRNKEGKRKEELVRRIKVRDEQEGRVDLCKCFQCKWMVWVDPPPPWYTCVWGQSFPRQHPTIPNNLPQMASFLTSIYVYCNMPMCMYT